MTPAARNLYRKALAVLVALRMSPSEASAGAWKATRRRARALESLDAALARAKAEQEG